MGCRTTCVEIKTWWALYRISVSKYTTTADVAMQDPGLRGGRWKRRHSDMNNEGTLYRNRLLELSKTPGNLGPRQRYNGFSCFITCNHCLCQYYDLTAHPFPPCMPYPATVRTRVAPGLLLSPLCHSVHLPVSAIAVDNDPPSIRIILLIGIIPAFDKNLSSPPAGEYSPRSGDTFGEEIDG